MAIITNIRHFLDENGEVPNIPWEAQELLKFLSAIIGAATTNYDAPVAFADTQCRNVISGRPCPGEIEVWVFAEDNRIGWECLECGDEGIISQWEGTQWDKRNYTCH